MHTGRESSSSFSWIPPEGLKMKARPPPSRSSAASASEHMAMWPPFLLVLLLGFLPHAAAAAAATSCPASCRCYSLTVECGSTGLPSLPKQVPALTQTLFLQDNVIGQIRRQDLSPLAHLHYLYLQNNSISAVEAGSFQKQARLLELALNGNRIHSVTADTFRGLEHLRILYLAANDITRLLDFTFRGLQRLQELHLQRNSIEVLAERALAGLSSLALLDLSGNRLHTMAAASLRPLVSLQVLRITENPWRCDCALHWLRRWMDQEGQRLLSSSERRLACREPPRLSRLGLLEVPPNSLVCIPPLLQLEPRSLAVRLGDSLRVSCHASGYPRPQVTWRKASSGKASPGPRGLVQDLGAAGGDPSDSVRTPTQKNEGGGTAHFDPDTGSGMLFLSNVTTAHAGFYECEAWNAGGAARLTFQLAVNSSTGTGVGREPPRESARPRPGSHVSREPLYALGSMAFGALGAATQTAIAAGISLLALTALLLLAMIYARQLRGQKDAHAAHKEESILYVNDYSDGPTTFAQLEEFRDERGHEMFVLNRAKAVPPPARPRPAPSDGRPADGGRMACEGVEAEPEGEGLPLNRAGLFADSRMAYEIHC
ncbi:leucine-rich repeat-containing protein 24-like [Corythoichthys intestinalis]|uniref:leucine-rich repeat-containing protein 24-like n=1 Tax=Corythoichthys intestinalis TaxID=161448 RepID=UPI0025A5313D|nr:leucine-rich repeat-containing protein 24-like [Corythoichthys intestinalis]